MPENANAITNEAETFDTEDALHVLRDGLDLLETVESTTIRLFADTISVETDRGDFVAVVRLENEDSSHALEEAHGGHWGHHPVYSAEDWRLEVEAQNTRLGYWDWVKARIEDAATG